MFCAVWVVEANKGIDAAQHRCYYNWSGSSAAMESDVIAEGISLSEQMYGLRYMSVIGDGDSMTSCALWHLPLKNRVCQSAVPWQGWAHQESHSEANIWCQNCNCKAQCFIQCVTIAT